MHYRFDEVDADGHVLAGYSVECPSDAVAIQAAHSLVRAWFGKGLHDPGVPASPQQGHNTADTGELPTAPASRARIPAVVRRKRVSRSDHTTDDAEQTAPAPLANKARKSAIITIRRPGKRFADVPEMTPKEHRRRGDPADAAFRNRKRQITQTLSGSK